MAAKSSYVDFPILVRGADGVLSADRPKTIAMPERQWLDGLLSSYAEWRDLVNLDDAVKIEREVSPTPPDLGNSVNPRRLGMARIDAVVIHADGACSLIEAKITSSPSDIMGGVGQLIYYKTVMEVYRGVEVRALVLAAPFLPPFVLDAIANVQAPVRFLKATDGQYFGLVPEYRGRA